MASFRFRKVQNVAGTQRKGSRRPASPSDLSSAASRTLPSRPFNVRWLSSTRMSDSELEPESLCISRVGRHAHTRPQTSVETAPIRSCVRRSQRLESRPRSRSGGSTSETSDALTKSPSSSRAFMHMGRRSPARCPRASTVTFAVHPSYVPPGSSPLGLVSFVLRERMLIRDLRRERVQGPI